MIVSFTVPGKPPGVNHAYAPAVRGGRIGFRKTDDAKAFAFRLQAAAKRAMRRECLRLFEGHCEVRLAMVYPNDRSDVDSALKLTLDALQGAVLVNDRQVRRLIVDKVIDRERPRIEIQVTEIAP